MILVKSPLTAWRPILDLSYSQGCFTRCCLGLLLGPLQRFKHLFDVAAVFKQVACSVGISRSVTSFASHGANGSKCRVAVDAVAHCTISSRLPRLITSRIASIICSGVLLRISCSCRSIAWSTSYSAGPSNPSFPVF